MNDTHIFIVNRKQDATRRNNILKLSQSYNLQVEFLEAVEGASLSNSFLNDIDHSSRLGFRQLSKGEIGCALSHKKIYRYIIKHNLPYAIILEDDVVFDKEFLLFMENLNTLPKDLDLLLLGYYSDVATQRITNASIWRSHKLFNRFKAQRIVELAYGTHGYFINQKGATKMLAELETIKQPIDHYTGNSKYVNTYAIRPRIIDLHPIDSIDSSINKERPHKRSKRNNEKLISVLRSIKTLFNTIKYIRKFTN